MLIASLDSLDDKGFLDAELCEITVSVQHLLSSMGSDEEIEDDEVAVDFKAYSTFGSGRGRFSEAWQNAYWFNLIIYLRQTPCRNDAIKLLQHYELLITNELPKLIKQTGLNPGAVALCC